MKSCVCMSGSEHRYNKTDKVREKSTERKKDRPETQTESVDYLKPIHSKSQ